MGRYAELNSDNIVTEIGITDSDKAESKGLISAPRNTGANRGGIGDGENFNEPDPEPDPNKLGVLSVNKGEIPADGETEAVVIYTSKEPVDFIVDGEIIKVEPDENYCTLEISADSSGPIEVKVKDKSFTIIAEEV